MQVGVACFLQERSGRKYRSGSRHWKLASESSTPTCPGSGRGSPPGFDRWNPRQDATTRPMRGLERDSEQLGTVEIGEIRPNRDRGARPSRVTRARSTWVEKIRPAGIEHLGPTGRRGIGPPGSTNLGPAESGHPGSRNLGPAESGRAGPAGLAVIRADRDQEKSGPAGITK